MENKFISVSEALGKIENGNPIGGYSVNFERIKVDALDAMKLSKAGLIVPDGSIFYDDEAIAFDEDFEGDWVRQEIGTDSAAPKEIEVKIAIEEEIRAWLAAKNIDLAVLIPRLLDGFYESQKNAAGSDKSL